MNRFLRPSTFCLPGRWSLRHFERDRGEVGMAKRRVRVEGVDKYVGVQKDHGSRVSSRSFSHVIVSRRGALLMAATHAFLLMRSARSGFSSRISRKRPSAFCWMSKISPGRPPGKTIRFLVSTVYVLMVGISHIARSLSRSHIMPALYAWRKNNRPIATALGHKVRSKTRKRRTL